MIPANIHNWFADPMLVDYNHKTYLFYEAVHDGKGRIEFAEVNEDCTLGKKNIILEDQSHYSYPYVFRYNGSFYMIPESSQASEVRLYKAIEFPAEWKLKEILLQEKAVDTTVYEINHQLYLLTFLINGEDECVLPKAYRMELLDNGSVLHEVRWSEFDSLKTRGAGQVIIENGKAYRPAQVNQKDRYGDGILLYEMIDTQEYHIEKPVRKITAKELGVEEKFVDGLHTFSTGSTKFDAIDVRKYEFDCLKIYKKLKKILNKAH